MSDDRLMSRQGSDDALLLRRAVRERFAVAAADLALPTRLRLTDRERTTLSALAEKLIRAIEDELRMAIAASAEDEALRAALNAAHVEIAVPILRRVGLMDDTGLVSALLLRTEQHKRYVARGGLGANLLSRLLKDEDREIGEQAMAIVTGQSRRFDRFSDPVAARTELSAELEHSQVWRVAAALRHYLTGRHGIDAASADAAVVAAAEKLLSDYDEGDSLEARSMRLARRLQALGRLHDETIRTALVEGLFALFLASLAVRAGLTIASAWEVVSDPRGRGAALLLKACGFDRSSAAAILIELSASDEGAVFALDYFDILEAGEASAGLRLYRVNEGYAEALARLERRA